MPRARQAPAVAVLAPSHQHRPAQRRAGARARRVGRDASHIPYPLALHCARTSGQATSSVSAHRVPKRAGWAAAGAAPPSSAGSRGLSATASSWPRARAVSSRPRRPLRVCAAQPGAPRRQLLIHKHGSALSLGHPVRPRACAGAAYALGRVRSCAALRCERGREARLQQRQAQAGAPQRQRLRQAAHHRHRHRQHVAGARLRAAARACAVRAARLAARLAARAARPAGREHGAAGHVGLPVEVAEGQRLRARAFGSPRADS